MGIDKILIVSLDNLGDTVMATSVLKPLRAAHPQAELGLWVKRYTADLFTPGGMIAHVHASDPFWDTAPGLGKGNRAEFMETWRQIKTLKYDMAVILNTEWRRALACFLAGIPKRIGYKRRKSSFFLTHGLPYDGPMNHVVQEHGHLVNAVDSLPMLECTEAEKEFADTWLTQHGWKNNSLVLIHLFAGHKSKCWPLLNWMELIRLLYRKNENQRFGLIVTPTEKGLLKNTENYLPKNAWTLVPAELPLLKGLMMRARFFIGGDSGPGHMAAALGTPVVSLFGHLNANRYRPVGAGPVTIIERSPIDSISVETVFKTAARI